MLSSNIRGLNHQIIKCSKAISSKLRFNNNYLPKYHTNTSLQLGLIRPIPQLKLNNDNKFHKKYNSKIYRSFSDLHPKGGKNKMGMLASLGAGAALLAGKTKYVLVAL